MIDITRIQKVFNHKYRREHHMKCEGCGEYVTTVHPVPDDSGTWLLCEDCLEGWEKTNLIAEGVYHA